MVIRRGETELCVHGVGAQNSQKGRNLLWVGIKSCSPVMSLVMIHVRSSQGQQAADKRHKITRAGKSATQSRKRSPAGPSAVPPLNYQTWRHNKRGLVMIHAGTSMEWSQSHVGWRHMAVIKMFGLGHEKMLMSHEQQQKREPQPR